MRAVENGATALTASRRLARVLIQQFNSDQRKQRKSVWRTPVILPMDAYLRRCWSDWIVADRASHTTPMLLSSAQEQAVWEQIIRASPQGESLLRIPETARAAMDAWRLAHSYRLPIDGRFEASEDAAAFLRWSKEFRRQCELKNWLEEARLSDFVADLLSRGEIGASKVVLAGFDDLTPQQSDLLETLGEYEEFPQQRFEPAPTCYRARDCSEEIQLAARWSRDLLERNPDVQIGIVVPGLSMLRSIVERIFREELHPGPVSDDAEHAFHLSLGPRLSEYPMIHAAFLLLELAGGEMPLPRAGILLRSPFLGGAETERQARAALDARWRRRSVWNVSLSFLRDQAVNCPQLQRIARRAEAEIASLPSRQNASEWSRSFSKLLRAFGWPGERALSSREYQTVEAWHKALSNFAALDGTGAPFSFAGALEALRYLAGEILFQVENEGAPIQIMGALESSGISFDHLWVTGLHDEALPAPARPNPFLPLAIQREYRLPHASAERELEFAGKIVRRLLSSAPDVVLSYPMQEGEQRREPTPLVAGVEWRVPSQYVTHAWADSMKGSTALESLSDELAPQMPVASEQRGGASLFRDMAACPFRAFAQHRLNARPLEDSTPGLAARDKGMLVHKALELIWAELRTQERLRTMGPVGLSDLISRAVRTALDLQSGGLGRSLEQIRLEGILKEWMEIERGRPPFIVHEQEQKRIVAIGGLSINMRIDRVDELPDGRRIILDYKTGEVKANAWMGERPTEPQVPLYCATSTSAIAGAALVQIQAGGLRFRGLDESASLPDLKRMQTGNGSNLTGEIEEWRRVLTALAERFREGHAEVDPLPGACDYCGITALCRIRELKNE